MFATFDKTYYLYIIYLYIYYFFFFLFLFFLFFFLFIYLFIFFFFFNMIRRLVQMMLQVEDQSYLRFSCFRIQLYIHTCIIYEENSRSLTPASRPYYDKEQDRIHFLFLSFFFSFSLSFFSFFFLCSAYRMSHLILSFEIFFIMCKIS